MDEDNQDEGNPTKRPLSVASIYPTVAAGLHRALRLGFPAALWRGLPDRRTLALTFDDGPVEKETPDLLAVLARYNIRATFFHMGSQAEAAPHLVRQVADAGHQIGIHGYGHRAFPLLAQNALRTQLARTQATLAAASGRAPAEIIYVRPPYGLFWPTTFHTLTTWHYRPVMWSLVPLHWSQPLDTTVAQVLESVTPGTLLVLHEGLKGPTAAAMAARIVPHLLEAGYTFITIDGMWQEVMA